MRNLKIKPPRYDIFWGSWVVSATWEEDGELHAMGSMITGGDKKRPLPEKLEREVYKRLTEAIFKEDEC